MTEQTNTPINEWLDSQEFYELCQQYRHAVDGDFRPGRLSASEAYAALKDAILVHHKTDLQSAQEELAAARAALEKVVHATDFPEHKREDAEFLRACSTIAKSFASAALGATHD